MLIQQRPVSNWENAWLLCIGSSHSLFKIPRKFSVIKKVCFSTYHVFPQIVFSGAGVWSREHINRASGGHTGSWIPTVAESVTWQHHQTRSKQPLAADLITARQPARYSIRLFIFLFNKRNKLNLLVSLIFLATTRLYITMPCSHSTSERTVAVL